MGRLRYSLLATALLLAAGPVLAGDGSLGGTSEGGSDLDLTLPPAVKITGVGGITMDPGASALGSAIVSYDDVCIYSNANADRTYKVTAVGDGAAGAFTVSNGTEALAYTVKFNDEIGGGGDALTKGVQSGELDNGSQSFGCTVESGTNASYEFTMSSAVAQGAVADDYIGALTLTVAPGAAD